jgi:hypothetical protein
MALEDGTDPPKIDQLADGVWAGFLSVTQLDRFGKMIQGAIVNALGIALSGFISGAAWIAVTLARGIMRAEGRSDASFQELASAGAEDLFGVPVRVRQPGVGGGRKLDPGTARSLGDAVLKTIANTSGATAGGELQPSMTGAEGYLTNVLGMVFEGWLEGAMVDTLSLGYLGKFGDLDDLVYQALGFGRLSRRVLSPLVDATVATPAEWFIHKTYRPTLLSTGEILKAFQRGDYTGDEAAEELSRLGYSNKRQDNLLKSAVKRLSLDEVLTLVRQGTLDRAYALQNLRDEGFDEQTAQYVVVAAESKRFDAIQDNSLPSVIRAYVNRDISESEFRTYLPAIVSDPLELDSYVTAARTQRGLNIKRLSHGEVIDCVELGILSRVDYRRWLEREGYPPEDAAALELRLVKRHDEKADIEDERQQIAAARAAEKAAKDEATAKRKAEIEAERALHRRGPLSDLERAAIRGLVPLARVKEVLAGQYDADTVDILLDLVEGDRVAYVEQQQRAADAKLRAGRRNIDVGDVERAVLADVLSLNEYRARLVAMGFDAGDVAILSKTLAARKADLDDARAKRAAAEQEAKRHSIDLSRFERLVRRGLRTFAQYDALLTTLGFDDGSRAAMADLLRLDIADDEAAREARNAPKPPPAPKGLTLEQMRRAVVLGLESDDAFQTYLGQAGYTSDAQRVLLAELRRDVADAEAARRQREATETASGVVVLPLSRVARAARLGLISPATYQARLVRDGYTADDIAIELELLLVEIADERAAQTRRDALAAALDEPRALTLQQIERAVKAGTQNINDYRFALAQVYGSDDVDVLARTLEAELETLTDARGRRVTIGGELAARTLSIGDLEAGVKAGALTFGQYRDQLIRWGYGADDAELLTALLVEKLSAAPAGGSDG